MINFITKYFWIFFILGMILGLFVKLSSLVSPYIIYILMFVLFLTILKIDFSQIIKSFKKPFLIIYLTFLTLIIAPLLAYLLAKSILAPEYTLAILILFAMPAGMATPAYSDIFKGNTPLSLIVTTISSLLAPITIPIILLFITGTKYNLSFLSMFQTLAMIIFIPFILAFIIKKFAKTTISKTQKYYSAISVIAIMIIIMGAVAKIEKNIITTDIIFPAIILLLITIIITTISYFAIPKSIKRTKISSSLAIAYINSSLAIVFASGLFSSKTVLLIILHQFIGNLTLIGFGYLARRN